MTALSEIKIYKTHKVIVFLTVMVYLLELASPPESFGSIMTYPKARQNLFVKTKKHTCPNKPQTVKASCYLIILMA